MIGLEFYTSVMSLCLGFISFFAALFFYDRAKQSEIKTNKILNDISKSTNMLDSVTTRLLDKTIGHISSSNHQLIEALSNIDKEYTISKDQPLDDLSTSILLYSYTIKTMLLSSWIKKSVTGDKSSAIYDSTFKQAHKDFISTGNKIESFDKDILQKSELYNKYILNKSDIESLVSD